MARYLGPRFKIVRRLDEDLPGLTRVNKKNIKKQYPPGEHGQSKKSKPSDYQLHLVEKQKLRFHYGVLEKQLSKYSKLAFKSKKNTGLVFLYILERRLDNVLFRSGFFATTKASRQAIVHKHILLNGNKTTIPSHITKTGDIISFAKKYKVKIGNDIIKNEITIPTYIAVDNVSKQINVISNPTREDIPITVNEQLVVEYYSGR
jgi:small subunit ribosomal protein S4